MTRTSAAWRWALAGWLAATFLAAGGPKLVGIDTPDGSSSKADFARWGFPDGFRHLVGFGEVLGALFLLLPHVRVLGSSLRFVGACGLALDMFGAGATHLLHNDAAAVLPSLVLFALSALLVDLERPGWLRAAPRPLLPNSAGRA